MKEVEKKLKNISRLIQIMFIWIFFLLLMKIFEDKLLTVFSAYLIEGDVGKKIVAETLNTSYQFLGLLFLLAGFFIYLNIEKIRGYFKKMERDLKDDEQSFKLISEKIGNHRESWFDVKNKIGHQEAFITTLQESITKMENERKIFSEHFFQSLNNLDQTVCIEKVFTQLSAKMPFGVFREQMTTLLDQIFKMQLVMVDMALALGSENDSKKDFIKVSEILAQFLEDVSECSNQIKENLDLTSQDFERFLESLQKTYQNFEKTELVKSFQILNTTLEDIGRSKIMDKVVERAFDKETSFLQGMEKIIKQTNQKKEKKSLLQIPYWPKNFGEAQEKIPFQSH